MSLARSIARHTAIQTAGKVVGTFVALVTVSIMLRYLGTDGFGEYTTIVTFLSLFSVIGDLGLYLITTREISSMKKAEAEKFLSAAFGLKLTAASILVILAAATIWLFPYSLTVKLGVLAGSMSYFFIMANQVLVGIFQKHLAMHKIAISEIISRFAWLGGVVVSVVFGWNILIILLFISAAQAINFFMLYGFARGYYKIRCTVDWEQWKKILKVAAPLALSVIFNLVYFKIDTLILSLTQSQEHVGIYGAAYKVLENLITFAAVFAGIMLPVLARGAKKNKKLFVKAYRSGVDVISLFMAPLIVGTFFLAEPVILLFGGEEFAPSAGVLRLLIFAVAAIFFAHLTGNAVVALGKEKMIMWIYLGVAIFALIMDLIFIPRFSYMAAAVITVISEIGVFLATGIVVWRVNRVRPLFRTSVKAVLASLVMALVFVFGPAWTMNSVTLFGNEIALPSVAFWIQFIGGIIVYVVALLLLRGVSMKMLREVVSMRKIN